MNRPPLRSAFSTYRTKIERMAVNRRSLLVGGISLAFLTGAPGSKVLMMNAAEPVAAEDVQAPKKQAPKKQDFRVSIEIFDAKTNQLLDRHLVLFSGGKIYDIAQLAPQDVMVIDPIKGEVTLLSRQSQIQTRIQSEAIVGLVARVRAAAAADGQKLGIGAVPIKDESEYSLAFDRYSYKATVTAPEVPFHAKQFVEFTDWAARVNLVRTLGPPPFGRMALGNQMASDGVVPTEMTLTCKSDQVDQTFKLSHRFVSKIDQADQKRITEVEGMVALYRQVPLKSFPK